MKEAAQVGRGWNASLPWLAVVVMLAVVVVQSWAGTNLICFTNLSGEVFRDVTIVKTNKEQIVFKVGKEPGFKSEKLSALPAELAAQFSLVTIVITNNPKIEFIRTNETLLRLRAMLGQVLEKKDPLEMLHFQWACEDAMRAATDKMREAGDAARAVGEQERSNTEKRLAYYKKQEKLESDLVNSMYYEGRIKSVEKSRRQLVIHQKYDDLRARIELGGLDTEMAHLRGALWVGQQSRWFTEGVVDLVMQLMEVMDPLSASELAINLAQMGVEIPKH
jgi:hypothetical protein